MVVFGPADISHVDYTYLLGQCGLWRDIIKLRLSWVRWLDCCDAAPQSANSHNERQSNEE